MKPKATAEIDWSRLSGSIAEAIGLYFPPDRQADLQRGLTTAAVEFGFSDVTECAGWLGSAHLSQAQWQVLVRHLAIGETYFLREKKTFAALTGTVLPALIHARRGRDQRLRFWSAACSSGEEAYSLAILLRQMLPDLADWQVTILATDINARSLEKAVAGAYGEWSFRDAPSGFKETYFERSATDRYLILPEIRKMVTFAQLNLADDVYPALGPNTDAMDLILCRNVLMYFSPEQACKAGAKLYASLVEGGWLAVSPSEVSRAVFPRFTPRNFPGAILYQKTSKTTDVSPPAVFTATVEMLEASPLACEQFADPAISPDASQIAPPAASSEPLAPPETQAVSYTVAEALYLQGRYAEAANTLLESLTRPPRDPRICSLLARAFANQGQLTDALVWCDRWIQADKLDRAGHYLRAVTLLEMGDPTSAKHALQRAVYLDPGFVIAYFALGNLARAHGAPEEANRHFNYARQLLARHPANAPLPEAEGLTAARLAEMIDALTSLENAR